MSYARMYLLHFFGQDIGIVYRVNSESQLLVNYWKDGFLANFEMLGLLRRSFICSGFEAIPYLLTVIALLLLTVMQDQYEENSAVNGTHLKSSDGE
uniref:Ovule protein n=1 Tax=Ascaris lumbricoides TaxID=6252 RepID=A0A0M3IJ71_ASCLU